MFIFFVMLIVTVVVGVGCFKLGQSHERTRLMEKLNTLKGMMGACGIPLEEEEGALLSAEQRVERARQSLASVSRWPTGTSHTLENDLGRPRQEGNKL